MADVKEEKEIWQEIRELRDKLHNAEVNLREEIHCLDLKISYLDKKLTILFLVVIFLIIFLNQNTLEFLFKVLGLLK